MLPINVFSASLVAAGFFLVLRAFFPMFRSHIGPFGRYLMRGAMGVAVVSLARSGYWDFLQYLLGDNWPMVRAYLGGQAASAAFNLAMLFPISDFLKARWYLIPENERHQWHWWASWAHPNTRCILYRGKR